LTGVSRKCVTNKGMGVAKKLRNIKTAALRKKGKKKRGSKTWSYLGGG